MADQLFLIRHGETEWALAGRHTGLTDIPLTEKGKAEAKLLGARLKSYDFEHILVSPLQRALETCRLAGLAEQAQVDPDLCEWDYGTYEGRTSKEIQAQDPTWNVFTKGAPGGESVEAVCHRADRLLQKIEKTSGDVCLFSSAHFLRLLTTRWLKISPENGRLFILFPASFSLLGYERTNRVIVTWNDTAHLKGG